VERPGVNSDTVEHSWQGYLLELPSLSTLEFDEAIKSLPAGDYSAERLAVESERVRLERLAEYPPIEEYIDGVVKGDDAQIAAYITKCLDVKKRFPLTT
jgi:hypothetical protein